VARYYLVESAGGEVDLAAGPAGRREHHEHRWLAYEDARALLVERLRAVIDWAEARVGDAPGR
jgi:bis(5'-nucleosidyl)-tetraphosphatase